MKEQNFGSFLALSESSVLAMLFSFVLCVVASVTKAGKIISDSLELFSLCVSVVAVVVEVVLATSLGVVLANLLRTNAGTKGGFVVVCSTLVGNCTPIS